MSTIKEISVAPKGHFAPVSPVSCIAERSIDDIRVKADELMQLYSGFINPSREKSLAITNLEQSVMWAVKSLCIGSN